VIDRVDVGSFGIVVVRCTPRQDLSPTPWLPASLADFGRDIRGRRERERASYKVLQAHARSRPDKDRQEMTRSAWFTDTRADTRTTAPEIMFAARGIE